jgi:hypothetical protein
MLNQEIDMQLVIGIFIGFGIVALAAFVLWMIIIWIVMKDTGGLG